MKFGKAIGFFLWSIASIGCALVAGVVIGERRAYKAPNKIDTILSLISADYVDSISVPDMTERAMYNIVSELDPHSTYIAAGELQQANEEMNGQFGGIGITYFVYKDTIVVATVTQGGPASKAGIIPGDRLLSINGKPLTAEDRTEESTLQTLRGDIGTTVQLGILHKDAPSIDNYIIRRDYIPQTTVRAAFQIAEGIGYIKIWDKFSHSTYNEFMQAAAELQAEGCQAFILDLRMNGGGAFEAAYQIVNEFLPAGKLIVSAKGRIFSPFVSVSDGTGQFANNQLVVLVDQMSASASEIVAGAIQDNDRGLIIGRLTYGKGLVQRQIDLADGSAVRLTVARYYTPSGRNIQRPYELGHSEEYTQGWVDQFNWDNSADDDVKGDKSIAYKTAHNRTVYGSGGIMPDIFVPLDTAHRMSYYISLEENDVFNRFAYEYIEQNRELLSQFTHYPDLLDYLKAQQLLYKVVMYAEDIGIRRRSLQINRCYKEILQTTYAHILLNIYGEQAFYPVYLYGDPMIAKGIRAIQKELAYPDAVIAMQYTAISGN
ncbi:peptidase S41 [Bacteroidia bacterium]|nr:peptidase S41 [Bacteroidia bacterium]